VSAKPTEGAGHSRSRQALALITVRGIGESYSAMADAVNRLRRANRDHRFRTGNHVEPYRSKGVYQRDDR
jgi:hypothetical protein